MTQHSGSAHVRYRTGRESVKELLRKPATISLLTITTVAQIAVVDLAGVRTPAQDQPVAMSLPAMVQMAPEAAQPDPALRRAWMEKTLLREFDRVAAEQRSKGFDVSPQLAIQIGSAASEFGISPSTAFGLVRAESSFRNQATSSVGAVGLTQLMPRTAAWIEPGVTRSELRDPETNLRVGFKYLRYLIDRYDGNEKLALLAYNRGPGTVDKAIRRGRNPDNGYADFVYGKANHGHRLFTR